ncbi:MAG: RING finger domain-containing protein [Candidatus Heimdallarchaeaceae archaeon]
MYLISRINTIVLESEGIKEYEIEKLECYGCKDIFDPLEDTCNVCGAPRPRCLICYADLKPSEQEEVVELPCCGIFAHKEHIISWLSQESICPNCHIDLSSWLTKLKIL